ncbi:ABC transporter ATP-binding protein [Paenibacillus sp. Marseille-P2973]|uniref:ABC transporter ATP-binding protein n=1 Tax=Paenibacillus TaxID=44249 RepID=UPI001B381EDF|nr:MULTISPECIES: ABC transporter ATP-binding protein [Paenibacillus]MBQ4898411.1 ABC transporter ATP-binding protein [Paenibacillus sp. Marseille-P2973]MDN4069150.1 ABC transporter ATP-binding protein [Paenibacillus vini]
MAVLEVRECSKIYEGTISTRALDNVSFALERGEFVGIMGPSGSGKTTLLNVIATIDEPTSGDVVVEGQHPHKLDIEEMALFRRRELGFIFQHFNLLDTLTVEENIVLPLTLDGAPVAEMKKSSLELARRLDIESVLHKFPQEISGGQMQRTAIARAMIHHPSLVLADEPTGNLDSKASKDVMEAFGMMNREERTTILMVTHDAFAASFCHRVLFIKDGRLYNEIYRGENRQAFFQKIIDMMSLLGGETDHLSSIRL